MPSRKTALALLALASLAVGSYLLAARATFRLGFPLDDAWIHQTYARNLAQRGEWAFVPGQLSAGSTSPLWTVLLLPAHLGGGSPYPWTFALGTALLTLLGWGGMKGLELWLPDLPPAWRWAGGIFLLLEWHMVWAAASGMETLLAGLWALATLVWLSGERRPGLSLGIFIGAGVWVRPDLLTLLGPALWAIFFARESASRLPDTTVSDGQNRRIRVPASLRSVFVSARFARPGVFSRSGQLLAGFALAFLPYLAFNRVLAGAWWPNTFYAKQREYAVLQQIPLLTRLGRELALPLVGAGALLLPGALWFLRKAWRRRQWPVLGGALWFLGYIALYAWRLPVVYQHGRYVIPAMPIFFLMGVAGVLDAARRSGLGLGERVFLRGWLLSLGVVLLIFFALGGRAYGQDVAVIESEMVAAAHWVNANTPKGSLVAAHDIGALGYFGERDILDLAGLVSPDVIPFLRDEKRLARFLDDEKALYLVTFPDWYPHLVTCGDLVYTTDGEFSPALGGENMAVYRWHGNCLTDE